MKIKLESIYLAQTALVKILQKELPFKTAYSLSKTLRNIKDELEIIEEKRRKIIEKHGVKDKNGSFSVGPDKFGDFTKDFNEVLDLEIELEIQKILLKNLDSINLSTADIYSLEPFLENEITVEENTKEVVSDGKKG